ncbi:MAG: putative O-glycosylation ligase, exosortase A system-associated [Telluria sp.]
MRDILICAIVFGSLPFILRQPMAGVLMWVWISVMSPHTQGWGFATSFPFAAIVAGATLASMVFARGSLAVPWSAPIVALVLLALWMNVTLPFSIFRDASFEQWSRVMKIMLMNVVVAMVVKSARDIRRLAWVLTGSLAYYGVKGGLFTLRYGGGQRVWGPSGTFIGDNNALALALIMAIPLMVFLYQATPRRWLRYALAAAMLLSGLAALGSYSRGGLLAIAAMCAFLWYKSRNKLAVGAALLAAAPVMLLFMPPEWMARMDTIHDYQADASALGRINAWGMAWNLARDRFFGGGFAIYEPAVFAAYAPDPGDVHAAHSIYFQVLGEHGFVGLGLYLLIGLSTWRSAAWTVRQARALPDMRWAADLTTMIQVSLVGFAVGGAFLSLSYFDVPYYLVCMVVATRALVRGRAAQAA